MSGIVFFPEIEITPSDDGIGMMLGAIVHDVLISAYKTEILFCTSYGNFSMYHSQDCCESVVIDDIEGDWKDIIGQRLLQATESTNKTDSDIGNGKPTDSFTWTFYKLATIKGYLTIRWLGESNGYYSESVSIKKVN